MKNSLNNDILTCWQPISDYLECSIRTCHRWRKKGLPVHYPFGENSSPCASKRELDEWRLSDRGPADRKGERH